jgi:hypothetical protein
MLVSLVLHLTSIPIKSYWIKNVIVSFTKVFIYTAQYIMKNYEYEYETNECL